MNDLHVYYITKDGRCFRDTDIKDAFYLTTGKHCEDCYRDYLKFLDSLFGKVITEYFPGKLERMIPFARKHINVKVDAVKMYRDFHNHHASYDPLTLREARDKIEEMIKLYSALTEEDL